MRAQIHFNACRIQRLKRVGPHIAANNRFCTEPHHTLRRLNARSLPTGRYPARSAIECALTAARAAIIDAGMGKDEIDTVIPTAALCSAAFNTDLVTGRIVEELGLRVHGILIGDRETIGLLEVCDAIHWVRDWRRYASDARAAYSDGFSPVHSQSLSAMYFPNAIRR